MGSTISPARLKEYDRERNERIKEFASMADLYVSGAMPLSMYKAGMQASLKEYYIRVALLAKGGRNLTTRDRQDVGKFLAFTYDYLDGFSDVLRKDISDPQALARSSSYANAWGVYTRFSIPAALADVLPALPGIDCLGGFKCGCWLEWSASGSAVEVYWHVNPVKKHCFLCLDFAVEWSPLMIPIEDMDSDLLEDEYDFLNDL